MAKITSKIAINVGTELTVDETARKITLNALGNLVAKDGVTWQALYSKFVNLWATATYQDSPFPFYAIDALSGKYQVGTDGATYNGWTFANTTTRQMLRDGGWDEYTAGGVLARVYTGVVGLGSVSASAQLYYQIASTDAPTNFVYPDQVNQGVQVMGNAVADPLTTTFDKRTYLKGFVREGGKKYKESVLSDTGRTATGPWITNLLLSNEDDPKVQAGDSVMLSPPYSNITVSYFTLNQSRTISGAAKNFKIIVDGAGATLEQIYTKCQYLLRQPTNINAAGVGSAGSVVGKTAASLMSFAGDTLTTANSVYIDNMALADTNRVVFTEDLGLMLVNPFVAAGTLNFNAFLVSATAQYRLMYTTGPGINNNYGQPGAITVLKADGVTPIAGNILQSSISFDFDYDYSTAGGQAGTDKPVTLVGVRPGFGKFTVATGVLTRSKNISLTLTAEQDRVYA